MPAPLVTVAGHVCLDIIPAFAAGFGNLTERLRPGALLEIGPATLATGGAVSNTGLALHRLGVPTQLMGKIGDDLFGDAILRIFRGFDPALAAGMLVTPGANTAYTLVLNPPGFDRAFLHCSGANDTLGADDIAYERLDGVPHASGGRDASERGVSATGTGVPPPATGHDAPDRDASLAAERRGARTDVEFTRLFHFGYPPLLRRFCEDDGRELERMFGCVKARGLVTSLDMAMPDPSAPGGRADWRAILRRALPQVDLFLPSLDEILVMLGHAPAGGPAAAVVDTALLGRVSTELLDMGVAVVGLKLGEHGLYVRTTANARRLESIWPTSGVQSVSRTVGPAAEMADAAESHVADTAGAHRQSADWLGRELLSACFRVDVAGTTGCGDCTIAGFLASLLYGLPLDHAVTAAVAVGACAAERPDATSGVPKWSAVQRRICSGWAKRGLMPLGEGWRANKDKTLACGPHDSAVSA